MAKTYDTYKDSGIAWIGEIPGEWEVCSLKYQTKFINGFAFNSNDFQKKGEMPVFRIGDIIEDNISIKDNVFVNKQSTLNNYEVRKGDILLAMSGATTGKIGIIKNQIGYINQRVGIVRSTIQPWIFYNLKSNIFSEYVLLKAIGSAQPNISTENFNNYKIPFPPLFVQHSISSFLDTKCGEIDSLISIQEEMISELLAYKQSVITEAVTKGLDKKAKMKNSGVEWIGDIPEEWVKDKIFRVFSVIGSGTTPKATDDRNFEGDINWIQSGDINGGKMFECKNKISENVLNQYSTLKIYKAPFIIVAMYGASVGNISISNIDGCVNQACCVMSNSNQCFNYLFYAIKAAKDYLIYRAEGGGQPNISQDKLKNLWLPLPPLPVQQAIATYLDEKTSQIDSLIALKQSKIESLKEYKKSIIYEYVTGKKRV